MSRNKSAACIMLFTIFSTSVFADTNSKVFDCFSSAKGMTAEIVIDSVSNSKMKIITNTGVHICALDMTLADDLTRDVVPYLNYEFEKKACNPTLDKNLEANFVKSIQLKLTVLDKKVTSSTLRWLRSAQPADCQIKVSRIFEARLNIKKWGDQHYPERNVTSGK